MSKPKHVGLLGMCKRIDPTDMGKMAKLTERARGNRTNAAFAEACGVSAATISRIINEKFKKNLSDDVVVAIVVNAVNSTGSVFKEFLDAHGLVIPAAEGISPAEQDKLYEDYLDQVRTALDMSRKTKTDQTVTPTARRDAIRERVQGIVQNYLINAGYRVARLKGAVPTGAEFDWFPDFILETNALEAEGLDKWAFTICETVGSRFISEVNHIGSLCYFGRPSQQGYRFTVVTTDWRTFYESRQTLRCFGNAYDSISILLVNTRYNLIEAEYILNRDVETVKVMPAGKDDSEIDWQEIYGLPDEAES